MSGHPYLIGFKELRKSINETGLRSTFTRGILEGILNAYHLIPQDWKDMMRMLLTPAQYAVWDSEYQRYAIQAGNNSGGVYIPDQLCVENIPLTLVLIPTAKQPTAVLTQELTTAGKSSVNILEWIYLSHSPGHTISSPDTMYSELILKARERS
ncbi:hypothetical protein E2320_022791 [Naja naja]|nr:hypothetical protein E2320_022791 [Naja naja]